MSKRHLDLLNKSNRMLSDLLLFLPSEIDIERAQQTGRSRKRHKVVDNRDVIENSINRWEVRRTHDRTKILISLTDHLRVRLAKRFLERNKFLLKFLKLII